eukprot:UN23145
MIYTERWKIELFELTETLYHTNSRRRVLWNLKVPQKVKIVNRNLYGKLVKIILMNLVYYVSTSTIEGSL